jgi:hypothetical protein
VSGKIGIFRGKSLEKLFSLEIPRKIRLSRFCNECGCGLLEHRDVSTRPNERTGFLKLICCALQCQHPTFCQQPLTARSSGQMNVKIILNCNLWYVFVLIPTLGISRVHLTGKTCYSNI